jgi:transitional endoplasmic reticulum ATPase
MDARRGVVRLHPEVLVALDASPGAALRLSGRRTTGALAGAARGDTAQQFLYCDDLTLQNLGVRDGEPVTVMVEPTYPAGRVAVEGAPELVAAIKPELLRLALLGKVVAAGDMVSLLPQELLPPGTDGEHVVAGRRSIPDVVGTGWTTALLRIAETDPDDPGVVTMNTVVGWAGGAFTAGSATSDLRAATMLADDPDVPPRLEDLPGLDHQAAHLREWMDLGMHRVDLLSRYGASVYMGALVHGPAGSGKASLVRAVTALVGANLYRIWAPTLASMDSTAAAKRLREVLAEAKANRPSLILIEDVEALAPRGNPLPVTPVLHDIVGDASQAERVAVVCTTSKPEACDPELRHPGRLEQEVVIPVPNRAERRAWLSVVTRTLPLAPDVQLDALAARTASFVGGDFYALAREAAVRAALRQGESGAPTVTQADLNAALEVVKPANLLGTKPQVNRVTFADIGDMEAVKQQLEEAVLWPLRYPNTFERLGVEPPHGMLLYGPPGCGKTFLIRALATEGEMNFISVKGPELLSQWVGESERAVRDIFRQARDAAPTLMFLDELDSLAPTRGSRHDAGTIDRVVASLLTELDGIEPLRNVVVIGATNRPDMIDPAMRRPGRLERLVYVPPPDRVARGAILLAVTRNVPLAPDADLATVASDTEGYSAADLAALVREAALCAMRESLDSPSVTGEHFAIARQRVLPSLSQIDIARYAGFLRAD